MTPGWSVNTPRPLVNGSDVLGFLSLDIPFERMGLFNPYAARVGRDEQPMCGQPFRNTERAT